MMASLLSLNQLTNSLENNPVSVSVHDFIPLEKILEMKANKYSNSEMDEFFENI